MKRRIDIWLALSIFVIPFLFTKATLDPVTPLRLFALAIVLTVLFLAILIRPNHGTKDFDFSILKRHLFLAFVLYLALSAISLTTAINKIDGVFELLKIGLGVILLIVLSSLISGNKNAILVLSRLVIICSLVLSLIGILQYYRVAFNEIPGKFEMYATMANRNLLSSFLLFSFPI